MDKDLYLSLLKDMTQQDGIMIEKILSRIPGPQYFQNYQELMQYYRQTKTLLTNSANFAPKNMHKNVSASQSSYSTQEPSLTHDSNAKENRVVYKIRGIGFAVMDHKRIYIKFIIGDKDFFTRFQSLIDKMLPPEVVPDLKKAIQIGSKKYPKQYRPQLIDFFNSVEKNAASTIETWTSPTLSPDHSLAQAHNRSTIPFPFSEVLKETSAPPSQPYQIIRSLGRGGMGEVFLVDHPQFQKCALKKISSTLPNIEEIWQREARILERQNRSPTRHLTFHKSFITHNPQEYCILMEYIKAPNLEQWISHNFTTVPSPTEIKILVKQILLPICQHLNFIHQLGIIHRDLTPRNILIQEAKGIFTPIIIDWGAAKEIPMAKMGVPPKPFFIRKRTSLETRIQSVGNPPEILEGYPPIAASDIYMFGNIMYFVLSGGHYLSLIDQARSNFVMSLTEANPHTPSGLNEILKQLTQYEPADRPTTLALVYELLLDIIE